MAEDKFIIRPKRTYGENTVVSCRMPVEMVKRLDSIGGKTGRTRNVWFRGHTRLFYLSPFMAARNFAASGFSEKNFALSIIHLRVSSSDISTIV